MPAPYPSGNWWALTAAAAFFFVRELGSCDSSSIYFSYVVPRKG
jgi:hypothetical protein